MFRSVSLMSRRKTKQRGKPKPKTKTKRASAAVSGTISELARSRGVSRSVVLRGIEVGALPDGLFGMRGRNRYVIDMQKAGAALDAFLASPTKLGRPKESPQSFAELGVDLANDKTWPADGPVLAAIKAFFAARDSKRAADKLAEKYGRADKLRKYDAECQALTHERFRNIPEACAGALASQLGVDIEAAREACAPMAADVERIIADSIRAHEACFAPTREGGS